MFFGEEGNVLNFHGGHKLSKQGLSIRDGSHGKIHKSRHTGEALMLKSAYVEIKFQRK